ncbi:hypothetical protein IIB79_04090, partial [candidate division KSB1 bacterium]|nr:hypothetical protein [candidate division KSB1 bacterium]
MIEQGLWKPKRTKKDTHRRWRQRKASFGEMIQFDGSYEHWLEDRGNTGEICLLAAIDDATSIVTKAKFEEDEGVFPVFGFWKEYLSKMGKPVAIYLDKFSTYSMNKKFLKEKISIYDFKELINTIPFENKSQKPKFNKHWEEKHEGFMSMHGRRGTFSTTDRVV